MVPASGQAGDRDDRPQHPATTVGSLGFSSDPPRQGKALAKSTVCNSSASPSCRLKACLSTASRNCSSARTNKTCGKSKNAPSTNSPRTLPLPSPLPPAKPGMLPLSTTRLHARFAQRPRCRPSLAQTDFCLSLMANPNHTATNVAQKGNKT